MRLGRGSADRPTRLLLIAAVTALATACVFRNAPTVSTRSGIHHGLVDTLTVNDVVWTCRLMARISDRQWRDAFRAAGYADTEQQRFITKLKSKIDEGLALAGANRL